MPSLFRAALVLLLPFSFTLAPAHAQSAARAAVLTGDVADPTGAAIAGAHLRVLAPDGHQVASTVSGPGGSFTLRGLATGAFTVEVEQPGFAQLRTAVRVGDGRLPPLHLVLRLARVEEAVTVSESDTSARVSTEIGQNQSANSVDREALDRLPVFDQDYITALSRFLNPDATGTNGITLVVNGAEANGPGVTPSAVASVKINQNPYTALFARPGRARIEITTASGTPQLHGTGNFLYRDSLFDARNPFAVIKPGEQRTYYEGSLTGPLSANKKTTFLASLDKDNDNQQAIVVAALPSGTVTQNVPNPTRHYFLSGRVFHDYGTANQLWIGYSYEHRTIGNAGVGGTVLAEAATNTLFFEHEINVGHVYVFSPRLLNQLHFLVGHFDNQTRSLSEAPHIVVSGAFSGGGAQADARRTEYHFDGTDILTWTHGRQELKFGVDIPDISRRGFDDFTNHVGTYQFASLSDYATRTPFTFTLQRGQGHVTFLERTVAGIVEDTVRVSPRLSVAAGVRYYWQNYFHDIAHDLAPRFSFAFAPQQRGNTVIRGGAGLFFDRTGPGPIADLLHFNGVRLQRFIVDRPSYPATEQQIASVPTSIVALDPRQRIPYVLQGGVGIERQLTQKSSLAVNYVGTRGIDLFRSVDANAPQPPFYLARPNHAFGQIRELQSEGSLKSNSLEVTFRGRIGNLFSGQAQYNLGKTYNNTSGVTFFPADSYAPKADWARSDTDRRHKLDLLGTWKLPRGFDFGTALSAYSGTPVNVTTGNDDNGDGLPLDRPAGVRRNSLHGPGYLDLDLNLARSFSLERGKAKTPTATISVNSFNVLNHANDITYVGVVSSPFFGHPVSAQPPRRMQLNLEVKF